MLFNFRSTFIFGFALLGCFALQAQVTVNASGGTATANYTNLSDAFAAINSGTHTGSMNILLTASTSEPANPTALLASGQSSANYSSINIYPTVAGVIVEGNAASANRGVIELDGADNVSINGNLSNGTGASRDLTIRSNAGLTTGSACVRLIGRTTGGLGTNNITIRNCNLIGSTSGNTGSSGSTSTTTYGIYAAAPTSLALTGSGSDYDNLSIVNNNITRAYVGINVRGGTGAAANQNAIIRGNIIGSNTLNENIGLAGITLSQMDVATVENNEIFNIVNSQATVTGIEVGGASSLEVALNRNRIHGLVFNGTGTNTAYGINITNGDNHFLSNNLIYNLSGINNSNTTATTQHVVGIRLAGSNPGYRVFHNSIYLSNPLNTGSTTYGAAYALIIVGTRTGFDVRNNIFANTTTSNATDADLAAIWFTVGSFDFTASTFNNNAYWVGNTAGHKVVRAGSNYTTLADFRTFSNSEANGVPTGAGANAGAFFPSATDLRLADGTTNEIESAGASVPFVNSDFLGLARPAFGNAAPDLGAFEFDGINPNASPACNLSLALRAINPLCAGSTGTGIIDSVPNGTAPFSYVWSSGATTAQATGLLNGNTAVTVTDNNGCTVSGIVSVSIPSALFVFGSPANPRCQGGNDGLVSVFVSDATPPYSYIWNDGTTTESRFDLVAGIYSQTVSDANGCFLSNTYTITDGPSFTATTQIDLQGRCVIEADINVSVDDQTFSSRIFTFVWNDGTTTQNRNGLTSAGVYSLTVTNDFNCTATASATVNIPSTVLMASFADSSQASCATCADGSLTAQAIGGQGPYTYLWSNGQTSVVATGLMPGTNYNFTLTDDLGCQIVSDSATVSFSVNLHRAGSELSNLQLFPNPAKHYLQITGLEANRAYRLRLINALGQTLSEQEIQGQNFEFNCSQLPQGTYYWQIWADNQQRSLIWVKQ